MSEESNNIEKIQKFYGNLAQICEDQQAQIAALQAQMTELLVENQRLKSDASEVVQLRLAIQELQSHNAALRALLDDSL